MKFAFEKYEGLGNDFVVVGDGDLPKEKAMALCDRHRGVGADGVLVCGKNNAGLFMRVINADGSVPEMCGNGLRCAAHFLRAKGLLKGDDAVVNTGSGPHHVWFESFDSLNASVRVEMNAPSFDPQSIGLESDSRWIDQAYFIDDLELQITAVSMGNPHLVTFNVVDERRYGFAPKMQSDARLKHGANVGFCEQQSASSFVLHVFERGAGWTQACGTGACAAVAAAVATERANSGSEVEVLLPGGSLFITERGTGRPMWMRGPARRVFSGELEL